MDVLLFRYETGTHGTFGKLIYNNKVLNSLEPPWKDNKRRLSCIPAGEYLCTWHWSPKYGWVYKLKDVHGRTFILTHWGNFGGDTELGFKTNTLGCILIAKRLGFLKVNGKMQKAILNSRSAVRQFFTDMNRQPFLLDIRDGNIS